MYKKLVFFKLKGIFLNDSVDDDNSWKTKLRENFVKECIIHDSNHVKNKFFKQDDTKLPMEDDLKQLTCVHLNKAMEKVKNLKLMEELNKKSKFLHECKQKYEEILHLKNEDLSNLKESSTSQRKIIEKLQQEYAELKERYRQFLKSKVIERKIFLSKLEILYMKYNEHEMSLESLFSLPQLIHEEVQQWKNKCYELEREKACILESASKTKLQLCKEKEQLQLKISKLIYQVKLAQDKASEEVNARMTMERKFNEMEANQAELEQNLQEQKEYCLCHQRKLEEMSTALENEIHFQNMLEQIKGKYLEERQREKHKYEKLMEDLEVEKKRLCESTYELHEERKKRSNLEDSLSNYNQLCCDNQRLTKIVEEEISMRHKLESKIDQLASELSLERTELQKTRGALNKEMEERLKMHQYARDSAVDLLKKNQLIKTLEDELEGKTSIEFQVKCVSEKLMSRNLNVEALHKELICEKSKIEDLTKRCDELHKALSQEKMYSSELKKNLNMAKQLQKRIQDLEIQVHVNDSKTNEGKKFLKNLISLTKSLSVVLIDERQLELQTIKAENSNLKMDLENLKCDLENTVREVTEHKKKEKNDKQQHQLKIEDLKTIIQEEKSKRINAEDRVEQYLIKIKDIENNSVKEKKRIQEEFAERTTEAEKRHNEEREKYKQLVEEEIERYLTKIKHIENGFEEEKIRMQNEFEERITEVEKFHSEEQERYRIVTDDKIKKYSMKIEDIENKHGEEKEKMQNEFNERFKNLEEHHLEEQKNLKLAAERDIEKYLIKINDIKKVHVEEKMKMQSEFEKRIKETEKNHREEQVKYREMVDGEIKKYLVQIKDMEDYQRENKKSLMKEFDERLIEAEKHHKEKETKLKQAAEGEAAKLLFKIRELENTIVKEKRRMKDLEYRMKEAEIQHMEEEKRFKIKEKILKKEKEEIAEDLQCLVNERNSCSWGKDERLLQNNFWPNRTIESTNFQDKLKGTREFHQRLLDEVCRRNISLEAALSRTNKLGESKIRKEMTIFCHCDTPQRTDILEKDSVDSCLLITPTKKDTTTKKQETSNTNVFKENALNEHSSRNNLFKTKASFSIEKKNKSDSLIKNSIIPSKIIKSESNCEIDKKTRANGRIKKRSQKVNRSVPSSSRHNMYC